MGDRRGANSFGWKTLWERDHSEDLGVYGRITLKWIFRVIQIIHMTPGCQSGKELNTAESNGLWRVY
jgi:hypothetical protein